MVYRGRVVQEKKDHIIVLTNDYQYKKLSKKGQSQIGKEIMFLDDDIIKENERKNIMRYGVAAAVLLLFFTTVMVIGMNVGIIGDLYTYAVISLDINPSIEFRIDDQGIVKKVTPLNEEGNDLINSEMIGMEIKDAIKLGINNAIDKEYLAADNDTILISEAKLKDSVDVKVDIKDSILQSVTEATNAEGVELVYVESNKESFKEAEKNHMSVGKYELFKKIAEKNKNITIESIKEMKVTEIAQDNEEVVEAFKIRDFNQNRLNNRNQNSNNNGNENNGNNNRNEDKNQNQGNDKVREHEQEKEQENKGNQGQKAPEWARNKNNDSDNDSDNDDDDDENEDEDEDEEDKDEEDKDEEDKDEEDKDEEDKDNTDEDEDQEDQDDSDEDEDDEDKDNTDEDEDQEDKDDDEDDEDEDEGGNGNGKSNGKENGNGNGR